MKEETLMAQKRKTSSDSSSDPSSPVCSGSSPRSKIAETSTRDSRSRESPQKKKRRHSPSPPPRRKRSSHGESRSKPRRSHSRSPRDKRRGRRRDHGSKARGHGRSPDRERRRDFDRYRPPDRRSPKRRMKEHLVRQAAARQTQEAMELATKLNEVSNVACELEKPSKLPLNDGPVTGGQVTPQILLQQTMALMNAKTQALTGVALPKYYNIAAVNPLKYAEQIQKRKLLWQGAKDKITEKKDAAVVPAALAAPTTAHWEKAKFAQDQDGKMTAKFRKLMGIKEDASGEGTSANPLQQKGGGLDQQEALFRDLDQQYEVARMSTHTHRGVGLGYSSHSLPIFPK